MADSDRRVVHAPLRSSAEKRKNEFDKRCWDRLNTVLKLKIVKDSEVAEVLVDTLVVGKSFSYPQLWRHFLWQLKIDGS